MPKLKGLLDTARTKLTGLLGDFPQGFNAGAVAVRKQKAEALGGLDPYRVMNTLSSGYKVPEADIAKFEEWKRLTAQEDEILAGMLSPREAYKRLAGEAEARNVQSRMNLTMDERLALPPWATQDVPTEQQIVRFGDGASMAIEDFAARRAGKAKPYKEAVGVDTIGDMGTKSEFSVKPPKRIFRGVGEGGSTTGTYALGKGLYTSPDKSFAKMYGDVSEVSPDEAWPRNPLVLSQVAGGAPGAFADWALKTSGLKNMREFNQKYSDPGEFVRSLGYDGVIAGDEVVRYPKDQ